jgi:hypothetical protein
VSTLNSDYAYAVHICSDAIDVIPSGCVGLFLGIICPSLERNLLGTHVPGTDLCICKTCSKCGIC